MGISPFVAKGIYEQIALNSFLKVERLSPPSDDRTELAIVGDVFASATAFVMRKKNGRHLSPLLAKSDADAILENLKFFAKSGTLMAWAFVPIPMSVLAFPLGAYVPDGWDQQTAIIGPFVAIAVVLLLFSASNMVRFFLRQKQLGDRLWTRDGAVVEIPKSFRNALMRKNLFIWKGPVASYVADEVVNIIPSDGLKLTYDTMVLGNDVISLVRK